LPPEEDALARAAVARVRRPLVGVILGSSWPSRIYFPESVAAVIRELARPAGGSPPLFPVLIGAPEDAAIGDAVMRELDGLGALNLVGRTRLRDLIGIFGECAVAFGPDCGPMHIAAAVGCPVVSLWGATAPQRSAPWGYGDLVLHGEIPCHPCYLRDCPIGRECMRRIAPAKVAAMVRRALGMRDGDAVHPPVASDTASATAAAALVVRQAERA
jgi:heptosyltransferase-1